MGQLAAPRHRGRPRPGQLVGDLPVQTQGDQSTHGAGLVDQFQEGELGIGGGGPGGRLAGEHQEAGHHPEDGSGRRPPTRRWQTDDGHLGNIDTVRRVWSVHRGESGPVYREHVSAPAAQPTADAPRLGPYVLLRQIGEGGMGVVHLAQAPSGRLVAVKVLRPHVAGDLTGRARLAREVQALLRVSGPRVAAVLDADVQGPAPYLVTRYVNGPSLDEVIASGGPLGGEALLRLAWGLADALCAIHDAGVVHRDLKPSNVLLEDGEPVVIDFGIAQVADDARLTASGLFIGTPGFLAPEIVAGGVGGPASDLHAWAATMAFAATGRPPFGRGPMEVVLYNVSRGAADLHGVPPTLGPLVRGALAADPDDRIGAHELRDRVGALLGVAAGARPATIVLPATPLATRTFAAPPPTRAYTAVAPDPAYAGLVPGPDISPPQRRPTLPAQALPAQPLPAQPVRARPRPGQPAQPASVQPIPAPPKGSRPRPAVSLAGLAALAALGAVAPYIALLVVAAGTVLARVVDRELRSLAWRRSQRGPRGTDVLIGVVAAPWHLVVSVLVGAITLSLAALGALLCLAPILFALDNSDGAGPAADPTAATVLASLATLFVFAVWWGPGGSAVRRGTRRALATLTPTPLAGGVLIALLTVAALGLALAASGGALSWAPAAGPPPWWDHEWWDQEWWDQVDSVVGPLQDAYRG